MGPNPVSSKALRDSSGETEHQRPLTHHCPSLAATPHTTTAPQSCLTSVPHQGPLLLITIVSPPTNMSPRRPPTLSSPTHHHRHPHVPLPVTSRIEHMTCNDPCARDTHSCFPRELNFANHGHLETGSQAGQDKPGICVSLPLAHLSIPGHTSMYLGTPEHA